ncbi:MAG TPA: DUF3747 domain-containing protein [Trichocoleus sp.]
MKSLMHLKVATLVAATLGVFGGLGNAMAYTTNRVQTQPESNQLLAQAVQYGEQAVTDPTRVLLVAAPGSALEPNKFFVIEQQSNSRPCWNETSPGVINPLWTTFDFTGICGRYGDSNGYSIRTAGVDQGLSYQFRIEERDGNLILYGIPKPTNPDKRRVIVGRTNGKSSTGFTRINLDPGWSLAKRTYEGRVLGHIYATNTSTIAQLLGTTGPVAGGPTPTPVDPQPQPQPVPFPDVRGNRYAAQIARAAELGLATGYEDGTFRPTNTLTREEAVTLVMNGVNRRIQASVRATLPQAVYSNPFPDVAQNRWSALKISQAKALGIITGDFETGAFRPSDRVTRAELIAMLRKAAMAELAGLATTAGAAPASLTPTQSPVAFSDIAGHWGASTITELSGFCGIASPLNETGTSFAPNAAALRDYAATAIVRWVDCRAAQQGT